MIYENQEFRIITSEGESFTSSELGFINVQLSTDMYKQNITGNRKTVTKRIPFRSQSYFYGVDREPLSFKLQLALREPKSDAAISDSIRPLLSNDYFTIMFSQNGSYDGMSTRYDVISKGSPTISYVGSSKKFAIVELDMLCRHHTGYVPSVSDLFQIDTSASEEAVLLDNFGDEEVYPDIKLVSNYTGQCRVSIRLDSKIFIYDMEPLETMRLRMDSRTIQSNIEGNPYPRWGVYNNTHKREYLILTPGLSNATILVEKIGESATDATIDVEFSFNAPKYL